MGFVFCQKMGKAPPAGGRGLKAAIAPTAVEIEPVDMGLVDDGRSIHRHIHNPAPRAQQTGAADHGHQGHAAFDDIFHDGQVAALGIGIIPVNIAAKDQATLVRLADIKVPRAKGHNPVNQRL